MKIDKLYHLLAGVVIATTTVLITDEALIGLGAAVLAGVVKEVYDYPRFDWKDAAATAIGGLMAFII